MVRLDPFAGSFGGGTGRGQAGWLLNGNPLVSPPGAHALRGDQLLALGTGTQLERLERLIARGRV